MLFVKDHSTGLLFDRWSHIGQKRRKLLDQGWPGVFRNYLLNALPVNRIAFRFTERTRRPSKEAHLLLGSLILQQVHDLSEDDIQRAVAFNLEYQYALNTLDGSDASINISERTFRNYRRIIEQEGLAPEIFGTLTDRLLRAFDVEPSRSGWIRPISCPICAS